MSKFTEQLRTIGIFNPHNLVATGHPFVADPKAISERSVCHAVRFVWKELIETVGQHKP